MKKLTSILSTMVQLGCTVGLTAIALKRNKECYEAEIKAINAEATLGFVKLDNVLKDIEIKQLKKELEELKSKEES